MRFGVDELLDAEPLSRPARPDRREELGDDPAGHQPDQLVLVRRPGVARRHIAAVAQHRDAVADPADLLHAVGDVDDADAVRLDLVDQGEELLGLAVGERGGRLVEDEHREVGAERLGDLDHLLLGAGQIARHGSPGVSGKPRRAMISCAGPDAAPACRAGRRGVISAPRKRFSSTVICGTKENSWKTAEMPSWRAWWTEFELDPLRREIRISPAVGSLHAGEDGDQRRFAGAVLAEEDVHLAGRSVEVDAGRERGRRDTAC